MKYDSRTRYWILYEFQIIKDIFVNTNQSSIQVIIIQLYNLRPFKNSNNPELSAEKLIKKFIINKLQTFIDWMILFIISYIYLKF